MEQITKEAWLNALLPIHNGGRLNQLLSVMTGGNIQYIEWLMNMGLETMQAAEQAESGTGSEILSTAIACLIGIFLAQKIITKRNLK